MIPTPTLDNLLLKKSKFNEERETRPLKSNIKFVTPSLPKEFSRKLIFKVDNLAIFEKLFKIFPAPVLVSLFFDKLTSIEESTINPAKF